MSLLQGAIDTSMEDAPTPDVELDPEIRRDYRVRVPFAGNWREVLNTDSSAYGGSGMGNLGATVADDDPWKGFAFSARVTLPPLAVVWLRPDGRR